MTVEAEEFGAGLEVGSQAESPADPFMDEFRTLVDGLPDGATRESVAEYIDRMTKEADRAKELETKLQSLEQQVLAQQTKPESATPTPAAAAAEAQRRFEIAQVDQHLQPFLAGGFVQQDQSGFFVPSDAYRLNPQVLQACSAKNDQLRKQAELSQALLSDPYNTAEELFRYTPTYKSLTEQIETLKKQFDERLTPIQQRTEEQAEDAFIRQRASVLLQADPADPNKSVWSPAGQAYLRARDKGVSPDDAMELIQPFIDAQAAAAAEATAKAESAKKSKPRPQTVLNRITSRMRATPPAERGAPTFDIPETGRRRGGLASLRQQLLEEYEN